MPRTSVSAPRHVVLFQFRLGLGQSIGPKALRRIWSEACNSSDVTVSRAANLPNAPAHAHTYSLAASPHTVERIEIESRLRELLSQTSRHAVATLVRIF